jgi:hypothetical protein
MCNKRRDLAKRAFQPARVPLNPVATLGLNGKREQELMVIREAIVAHTAPELEADASKAAVHLLRVL